MAKVYLATQDSLQRNVAIKVLLNPSDELLVKRFMAEARTIAALNNPHIITIYDVAQLADGCPYFTMEYIDGGDLSQFKGQVIEPAMAMAFVRQVAEGLVLVHSKDIIHRDIKPANILFRSDGTLVLTDFGIAKNTVQDGDLTQSGSSMGSPSYSSPEQTTEDDVDHRADIYSLGVVLIELLLGYNPFKGENITQTVVNHLQMSMPVLPSGMKTYQALLNRMLAKKPSDRFGSADELLMAVNKADIGFSGASGGMSLKSFGGEQKAHKKSGLSVAGAKGLLKHSGLSILAVVCFIGVVFFFTYESEEDKKIRQLLYNAKHSQQEERFDSPKLNNAKYFFNQVLLLAPNNKDAIQGLKNLKQAQVAHYLRAATQSIKDKRWGTPEGDNAAFYYRKILSLEPNNFEAKEGVKSLAVFYVPLVQKAFSEDKYSQGFKYLKQGLSMDPNNETLIGLKEKYKHESNAFKRLFNRVFK